MGCTRRHRRSALCATFKSSPPHTRHDVRGGHVRADVHDSRGSDPSFVHAHSVLSLALARSFRRPPCDCSTGGLSSLGKIVVVVGEKIGFIVQMMKRKKKSRRSSASGSSRKTVTSRSDRSHKTGRENLTMLVDQARLDNNAT
jgi:hypothetical protein